MLLGMLLNPSIATCSGDDFLEVNPNGGQSILNIIPESVPSDLTKPFELSSPEDGKQVFPMPGYCIKSKTNKDEKVFINMCHCEDVPKPDEKLMSPMDTGEDESIRFPLGLGLPHKEKDKSGRDCICIDVLINTEFLNTLLKDEDARSFVLSLCIQGIADKYGIIVRDDCCLKLSKPYHGTVQKFFVKNTDPYRFDNPLSVRKDDSGSSTSLIRLMESSSVEDKIASDYSAIQSVRPKNSKSNGNCSVQQKEEDKSSAMNKKPQSIISDPSIVPSFAFPSKFSKELNPNVKYGLFQIPASCNYPMHYVLEAYVHYYVLTGRRPEIKVFVSKNRVVIAEKMYNFNVDINLPNPVIPERCQANYYDGTIAVVLPLAHCNHDEEDH